MQTHETTYGGNYVKHYSDPLPEDITLAAFDNDTVIFASGGKWLHPLFALEEFLLTYEGPKENLAAHDTAAGKAAAILMARMGIKQAHIDLVSDLAASVYEAHGIELSWERRIERLACKTEELLSTMDDEDQMYQMLKERATAAKARAKDELTSKAQ